MVVAPEIVVAAATDLTNIGSALSEASAVAAARRRRYWRPVPTRCRRP
ncbi:PE family protein [Mycobacterium kansasii]|uniref:PE family protein n=1 Tax=Mycobacterium kansasii TaxID=1768 RepID=A0A1V3WSI8_MYCKA|nr:PE family protein [Mycobacterium kansasii]